MTTTATTLFPEIIGQDPAKRKLAFFIEGYEKTKVVPHLIFTAPKGAGKTMLARAFAQSLLHEETIKPKKFLELNCATIKNLRQFVEQVMTVYFVNQDITILFDECSELPKDVTMGLLTMLNPNKRNRNTFNYEQYSFIIDFKKISFIFATTEPQDVFHALMDRLERIDLEDYTHEELGNIMKLNLEDIEFEDKLLSESIAPILRGNARAAQKMSIHITSYCRARDKNYFDKKDWLALVKILDVLPFGMTKIELRLLETLKRDGMLRLYNLAAKMQMTRSAIMNGIEVYLQKLNLIEVTQNGRRLTKDGEKLFVETKLDKEGKKDIILSV